MDTSDIHKSKIESVISVSVPVRESAPVQLIELDHLEEVEKPRPTVIKRIRHTPVDCVLKTKKNQFHSCASNVTKFIIVLQVNAGLSLDWIRTLFQTSLVILVISMTMRSYLHN